MNFHFSPKNDSPEQQHIKDVKIISIFNYVKWDRKEMVETIEKKLNRKKAGDRKTSWRFDCHLVDLVNYLWFKTYGYSKSFFGYVKMIRSGTMDRQEVIDLINSWDWGQFTSQMEQVLRDDLRLPEKYIEVVRSY